MAEAGHAELAELAVVARGLAREARAASVRMDERRAALARSALVWWQGGAAQAYEQAVRERVSALALLSRRLAVLADRYDELALLAQGSAAADAATAVGAWVRMP
jgi:hypothetical protein